MPKATQSIQGHIAQHGSQMSLPRKFAPLSRSTSVPAVPGAELIASADGISLRRRLLLTILPVILLPLVIAGALGYRMVGERSEEQVQEQLENQALLTSEGTTAVLEDLLDLPRAIAASPLVVNEAKAGGFAAVTAGLPGLPIEELEKRFEDTKLLRQHQRLNHYLKEIMATAEISELSITESHGFNVAYSEPTTDFVQSDETWWQEGKDQGLWLGSPDFDFAAKGYTVELAQAIYEPNTGDFIGVVRAVLPTRKFSLLAQYIKRTGISGSQQVQLIDGTTLKVIDSFSPEGFQKDRDIIGGTAIEQVISTFVEGTQQSENPQVILQSLKDGSSVEQLSIAFSDETTTVASFTDGKRQYKLANIPNTQWVAVASMDKADISAAGRDSLMFLALTTLLLVGGTTLLIFWLACQLSAPLGSLAAQAQIVAAGDFNIVVTPTGTRETRTLTQSFNQLVSQVRDLLQHQEKETQKAQLFAMITGASATSMGDLKPILEQALPKARTLLSADRVMFYPVMAQQSDQLAIESVAPDLASGFDYATPANCIPDSIFDAEFNDFPLAIDNVVTAELNPEHKGYLNALNVHSMLAMPVCNEDKLFGVLLVHSSNSDQWQGLDKLFIAQLSRQLRLVIDRITALKKIQESRQVAEVLTDENQQQTLQLSQHKEQLAQQSEMLLKQNEELRRQQQQLRQQSDEQRRQKEQLQYQVATLIEDIQGVFQGDLTVRARVAEGDLKMVADIFNLTVDKLQELVGQIQTLSARVNRILAQNEATAVQLISATLDQAQEADKTLEQVQTMIGSMGIIAENANLAAVSAKSVVTTAQASEAGISRTSESILRLNDVCANAVCQIKQLGSAAQQMNQSTNRIREAGAALSLYLEQINVQGNTDAEIQLFANITQEINSLTEHTLSETAQITTFLNTLLKTMAQTASDIGQVSTQLTETTQLVHESKQDLGEVRTVAQQFDQLAQSISKTTFSQSHISKSVFKLVKEVAEISSQTVIFSQKIEKTLHETVEVTNALQNSVSTLKVETLSQKTLT